jgi:hypothetical protein
MPTQKIPMTLSLLASEGELFTGTFLKTFNLPEPICSEPEAVFPHLKLEEVRAIGQWLDSSKDIPLNAREEWLGQQRGGQGLWHNFVVKYIQPKLNAIVEEALTSNRAHPMELAKVEACWPACSVHGPAAYSDVAVGLLGAEVFTDHLSLRLALQKPISQLVSANWGRLRKSYDRKKGLMKEKLAALDSAWKGELSSSVGDGRFSGLNLVLPTCSDRALPCAGWAV